MFKKIPINGRVEVVSVIGDIALYQGKPVVHSHIVVATADGSSRGRHVLAAFVSPTLHSSPRWSPISRAARRFISLPTSSRRTRPSGLSNSSRRTPPSSSTTLRLIPPGSTRSKIGSPESSASSLPAGSSHRSRTWRANLNATSVTTIALPSPSSGPIVTLPSASVVLPISLLHDHQNPALDLRRHDGTN